MVKVYLDNNRFIDIIEKRGDFSFAENLENCDVYISPLSVATYFYLCKKRVPDTKFNNTISHFKIANLSEKILTSSLFGPNSDIEDNIQLHSASYSEADYFLTTDKQLLKMSFFGKTRILSTLPKMS